MHVLCTVCLDVTDLCEVEMNHGYIRLVNPYPNGSCDLWILDERDVVLRVHEEVFFGTEAGLLSMSILDSGGEFLKITRVEDLRENFPPTQLDRIESMLKGDSVLKSTTLAIILVRSFVFQL